MEVRQIEFGKLKYAYILIKQFIESEGGTNINSLKNKVNDDLITVSYTHLTLPTSDLV